MRKEIPVGQVLIRKVAKGNDLYMVYNLQYNTSRNSTFPHLLALLCFPSAVPAKRLPVRSTPDPARSSFHQLLPLKYSRMSGNEYTLGLISKVRDQARALR
jgi:hypothetical protein